MDLSRLIKAIFQHSFIKFLFVAGLNTCFGYCMFALCVYVLKNVYAATIASNIIAILFNFRTYGRIVFKSKDNSRIFRFFGVYLFTMSLQLLSLKGLSLAGITNPYIAGGIIILPIATVSFLLMRKFVFTTASAK